MPPAARVNDNHLCNMADPPVPTPHVGGPIQAPCSLDVETNMLPQARATDRLLCTGSPAPDFIVTGSPTVDINFLMAARQTDKTMHAPPGNIAVGSPNVEIGGGTGGATLGNPNAGNQACLAAVAGRNPAPGNSPIPANTQAQNYNNCGVESSRQIINRASGTEGTPAALTQEGLLNQAIASGQASSVPGNMFQSGGGTPANRQAILAANGVPASQAAPNMTTLQQNAAERRGVMADVWAAQLWPAATVTGAGLVPGTNTGGHTVLVTGTQYDPAGSLVTVFINDTGTGTCMQAVPAATFQSALIGGGNNHVVTNNPIW